MANSDDKTTRNVPARIDPAQPPRAIQSILETALQQAATDLPREVVVAAQQEALRLEIKLREGQLDSAAAGRELRLFLEQVQDVSYAKGDVEMSGEFQRATGKTRVTFTKKEKKKWWPFS